MRFLRTTKARALAVAALLAAWAVPAHAANARLKEIEDEFIHLGESIRQIVVNIHVKGPLPGELDGEDLDKLGDLFRYFGVPMPEDGARPRIPMRRPEASGSGFIYDSQGHIVTNNHVVDGADEIEVTLWNGDVHLAKVVGRDPDTDLAVIKINVDAELPDAKLADPESVRVGQFAIAVGNPRSFAGSLSFGHVTALGRELNLGLRFNDFIQTDAAINLGNSGGPLCNIDGEVIGINTAIVYGAESLGFAVPVSTARKVIPQLIASGKVTRGYLGVRIIDADKEVAEALGLPDAGGAFVDGIEEDTPAAKAGVRVYDVIRKVNGKAIENSQGLVNRISDLPPGASVTLEVWRDEEPTTLTVKLDEYPDAMPAEAPKEERVLGIQVRPIDEQAAERLGVAPGKGVLVTDVKPGSAADESGVRPGDVVLEIAKQPVEGVDSFHALIEEHAEPGKTLLLRLSREDRAVQSVFLKVPKDLKTE